MSAYKSLRRLENEALTRFTVWFCSSGGVLETFAVVMAVWVLEIVDRQLDPNSLLLMAVLTVYSAITQPALAYAGTLAAARGETRAAEINERLARIEKRLGLDE